MKPTPESPPESLRTTAARWIVRRDRGLSATEAIEYELWLASDPRHAQAMQSATTAWSRLDRIPETVAAPLLATAARQRLVRRSLFAMVSLAAAVAVGFFLWSRPTPVAAPSAGVEFTALDTPRTLSLADGSLVLLNTGGRIVEQFTATERRVLLARGEAHFSVTKNPARPFIVRAGALEVRAVGTAFDINLQSTVVDVIVTEGRVQLAPAAVAPAASQAPALDAGERAVLRGVLRPDADLAQALVRSRLDAAGMADALAWREPLLRLGGATLAELAAAFERGTGQRLVFTDPALGELRFGGRFRADDVEGFTQVLATTLDLDVERAADGTIVLRRKNSVSR